MRRSAPFDGVAEVYDELYTDEPSRLEDAEFIQRWGPLFQDAAVLDVGCGTGWLLDNLGDRLWPLYLGFDLSPEMVRVASEKHPHRSFEVRDMEAQRWPYCPWDLVVSLWCSASYMSPAHFAFESARVLRRGGRVLAMPHATGSLISGEVRGDAYLPRECYTPDTGWRPWDEVEAKEAFAEHFDGVTVEQFGEGTPFLVVTGTRPIK